MATKSLVTIASKSAVITTTGFKNYEVCLNPYVGCEFGCSYCYVRFWVEDETREWGEFVRVRAHMEEQLPKALRKGFVSVPVRDGDRPRRAKVYDDKGNPVLTDKGKHKTEVVYQDLPIPDARLVIGTMTDPYQPQEKKYRITRKVLETLLREDLPHFNKVGIFTRSPLVLQDLELIRRLPRVRVHFTITPYPDEVTRVIEPFSPKVAARWHVIEKLKEAGVRVHVNVAPIMPMISEDLIDDFAKKLAELQVDEYFVDPMQAYDKSYVAFKEACKKLPSLDIDAIDKIMSNKDDYLLWKGRYYKAWNEARVRYEHLAPTQFPIWSDHENHVWVNMKTGQQLDYKKYNDDDA